MDLNSLYSGWGPMAASAWAKLDNDDLAGGASLSVVAHLADAAAVAVWLWDNFLAANVKQHLADALGGCEAAKSAVVFSAGSHDCGKISPAFALKADFAGFPEASARMQRVGLTFPIGVESSVPHGLAGQLAIERWLDERYGIRRGIATTIASVAGGHHGSYPSPDTLAAARTAWKAMGLQPIGPKDFSNCPWHATRTEVLDRVAEATGFTDFVATWARTGWPVEVQMLISGIVILADWLASDATLFPYGDAAPGRLEAALDRIDLPHSWRASPVDSAEALFRARFPSLADASPTPLQLAAVEAARNCSWPLLMIIEAPMGAGKTEAGKLAAETIAAAMGCGGVFIGLPTMATANPMFDRTLDWLDHTLTEDASVMLAHSKASLHDGFSGLVRASRPKGIYDDDSDSAGSHTVVASWLMGRKKSTQASFVVGTIDQLLLMALRAKHVSLRHLAMAGKVVIIDECHAADDYMRVYLNRALTWLALVGAPVILMSATLPPQQRQELADAYLAGLGRPPTPLSDSTAYPRLTVASAETQVIEIEPDDRRLDIAVSPIADDLDTLVAVLTDALRDGGCAAVIRNTVDRAQAAYDALAEHFGDDVVLLHSRFIAQHRAVRERDLVQRLGRAGDRPHRLIVVGTQVLEQSLDIDVDVMVSDLAPMDLLLQRAGRLHRHAREHRPAPVRQPRLLVTGADFLTDLPELAAGSRAIYGAAKLLRSASLITAQGRIVRLPVDIPALVNQAYDPDLVPPDGWQDAWVAAELEERGRIASQRDRAGAFVLREPAESRSLVGASDMTATDPESAKARGQRQVRDAEETIEVIVVYRDAVGQLRFLEGTGPSDVVIPESTLVDIPHRIARQLAATTLSLPLAMMRRFDAVEKQLNTSLDYTNWERSPWLKGQLALVLDESGCATVAGFELLYTNRKGLMYTTESSKT